MNETISEPDWQVTTFINSIKQLKHCLACIFSARIIDNYVHTYTYTHTYLTGKTMYCHIFYMS